MSLIPLAGHRLYYDLVGPQTAPVICMTHSLASDGGMWADQLGPLLAAGYRVLRLDMRGHGGSDAVAGPYTMSQLAADVVAALDHLAIERVHFIGLSIGGMIGQAFAIEHPNRGISAMWCDTMPAVPAANQQTWEDRKRPVIEANSVAPQADGSIDRWLTPAFKARDPQRYKQLRDTIAATSPAGYLGCVDAISKLDFVADLPKVKIPVLVVAGSEDAGTPPEANKRLASLVADGRYQEIAAARHFPNVEHPETFNRIMLDWFQAQRGRK
jgi:3-oxoadipate enol-lactonase